MKDKRDLQSMVASLVKMVIAHKELKDEGTLDVRSIKEECIILADILEQENYGDVVIIINGRPSFLYVADQYYYGYKVVPIEASKLREIIQNEIGVIEQPNSVESESIVLKSKSMTFDQFWDFLNTKTVNEVTAMIPEFEAKNLTKKVKLMHHFVEKNWNKS